MISEIRIGFLIIMVLYGVAWYIWHRAYTRGEMEPESFVGRVGRSFTVLFTLSLVTAHAAGISPRNTVSYERARAQAGEVWGQLQSTYYRQVAVATFLVSFASWHMLGLRLDLWPVLAPSYYMGLAIAFASSAVAFCFLAAFYLASRISELIAWARWDWSGREYGRGLARKRGETY